MISSPTCVQREKNMVMVVVSDDRVLNLGGSNKVRCIPLCQISNVGLYVAITLQLWLGNMQKKGFV